MTKACLAIEHEGLSHLAAAAAAPVSTMAGAAVLSATLLAAISLTGTQHEWLLFLEGVLAAAVLSIMSRPTRLLWVLARRNAQLKNVRARLARESHWRAEAEKEIEHLRATIRLIDEALPAIVCYVDTEARVRYHNHAYSRWSGRSNGAIDGHKVEEIVGPVAYAQIAERLREALGGKDIRYERTQVTPTGKSCRLSVQYLPDYSAEGKVSGVFAILTDITRREDLAQPAEGDAGQQREQAFARLVSALERDEFALYCQRITPLGEEPTADWFEVLLRMKEEEENHMPPGAFLPLAEELGLLHELDRWIALHVVDFAASKASRARGTYLVRLSAATIFDAGFAPLVRERLESSSVPGAALVFEVAEADVLADPIAFRRFSTAFRGSGCRFAVSGFGHNLDAFKLLKQLDVDFLKIDGDIVLNLLRTPRGLERAKAINAVAHASGMRIVADCVEDEPTRAALEEIETDFAMGFGIAAPTPIGDADKSAVSPLAPAGMELQAA